MGNLTVKLQIFVRYPFSYFWLETGSYELIFVLSRAPKQNYIEIRWPQDKINFRPVLNFALFSKVRKYEIKYRTKICDFTVCGTSQTTEKTTIKNCLTCGFSTARTIVAVVKSPFWSTTWMPSRKTSSPGNALNTRWSRKKRTHVFEFIYREIRKKLFQLAYLIFCLYVSSTCFGE